MNKGTAIVYKGHNIHDADDVYVKAVELKDNNIPTKGSDFCSVDEIYITAVTRDFKRGSHIVRIDFKPSNRRG